MSDKPDDSKKSSLENFIPPSHENDVSIDDNALFMKERHKKHQKYLRAALNTQKKIEKISQDETLIEAAKLIKNDNSEE